MKDALTVLLPLLPYIYEQMDQTEAWSRPRGLEPGRERRGILGCIDLSRSSAGARNAPSL